MEDTGERNDSEVSDKIRIIFYSMHALFIDRMPDGFGKLEGGKLSPKVGK